MRLIQLGTEQQGCVVDIDRLLLADYQPQHQQLEIRLNAGEGQVQVLYVSGQAAQVGWKQLIEHVKAY